METTRANGAAERGDSAAARRFAFSAALSAGLMLSGPGMARGVEDGLRDLAEEIIDRSSSAGTSTIAVAAFPHVDDTCSELSNYVADELVLNLFNVPGSNVLIVERSQLGRIFSEISLSMSGVVDANTTQEIGRIAGVDTLLVGSITDIGDQLRINARMLDTETAQVFSAAAVNIPRTDTVEELSGRPAAQGCTMERHSSAGGSPTHGQPALVAMDRPPLPGVGAAFDMGQLVGDGVGTFRCNGQDERIRILRRRTMTLYEPTPISIRARLFRNGRFNDNYREGERIHYRVDCNAKQHSDVCEELSLSRDLTRETVWLNIPVAGSPSLELVADGLLYGTFALATQEGEPLSCELHFGQVSE